MIKGDEMIPDIRTDNDTAPSAFVHPTFPPPSGRILESATEVPLALIPAAWILEPSAGSSVTDRGTPSALELGTAVSDHDGFFKVTPLETVEVREALCRLAINPDLKSHVLIYDDDRPLVRVPYEGREVVLTIEAQDEPSAEDWHEVAEFMAANRMHQAWQLAQQIAAPSPDSPIAGWSAGHRAAAIEAVSRSLTGESDAMITALLEQEHFVDLKALGRGETEVALNVFRNFDLFEKFGSQVGELINIEIDWRPDLDWLPVQKSDKELYRDYLRGVWITSAKAMHRHIPRISGGSLTPPADSALESQLDIRFHQNFRTSMTAEVPVHQIHMPIIRDALTAGTDRGGFGLVTVPPQGDQSDFEYVQTLMSLSGVSARELRNRLRVDFERPEGVKASRIDLNIEALQGLLSDTWQSPQEPFVTSLRGATTQRPLLFPPHLGRAPFYLQYEEWLERQKPFHAENAYEIRSSLPVYPKEFRDWIKAQKMATRGTFSPMNDYITNQTAWRNSATWVERIFAIVDTVKEGLASADRQNYPTAIEKLDQALKLVSDARSAQQAGWERGSFVWFSPGGSPNAPAERRVSLDLRSKQRPKNTGELEPVEKWFEPPLAPRVLQSQGGPQPGHDDWVQKTLARIRTLTVHHLRYLQNVLLPYLKASIYQAQGDLPAGLRILSQLTGYQVGIAEGRDPGGYKVVSGKANQPLFYEGVSLPYTTAVKIDSKSGWHTTSEPDAPVPPLPPFELRFFRIAQGEAMLALADQLYRNDDPSSIRRARELFKGVVFMHGEEPGISPKYTWSPAFLDPFLPGGQFQRNPALASQLARARLGLEQIERGLNVYGYSRDMVPVLRYGPLKQAADLFATSAKSAQTDFLEYMTRFEQAQIDAWQADMLVKKGEAGVVIAQERLEIAKVGVKKAQEQVTQVKAQITAKRKEIEDANEFFAQAKDFFGGMKDALTDMVPLAEKVANDDSPAQAVTGKQMAGIATKSFGGTAAAKAAAVATLGSGAGLAIGFGAFAYAGIMSMKSLEAAGNKRAAELKALESVALPAAEAGVKLAQRDVTIGEMQQSIARTELEYARTLARFQQERFLSVELWNKLSAFANRVMRRYVDLGARTAWLVERALEYEQMRRVDIIKLNYLPNQLRGVTGADRLMLDLAELEADRLNGIRLRAPAKHTYSLARDFPMQFGQLKKTGYCAIQTDEDDLRALYPGMYAFRTRAVTVAVQAADGTAPRGVMRNLGVSTVSREDGKTDMLVRFPDALPLSEFRLQDDLFVYGLPGETLLQFEGSGLSTVWEIAFPLGANARGLRSLTDVLITFDMHTAFSYELSLQPERQDQLVARSVLMAASVWDPKGLASLKATSGPIRVRFPLDELSMPAQEKNRSISNLALMAVGVTKQTYAASLSADTPSGTQAAFSFEDGIAFSNAGSLLGTGAPLPLNAIVGAPFDQTLTVEIDRGAAEEELRHLFDVVLMVEYAAEI
jgi:hypothetical protein